MSRIHQHRFDNGLILLAEELPGVQSLAMNLLVPAGVAQEDQAQLGVGAILSEMMCRGAGTLDARGHSQALDHLGIRRRTNVEMQHLRLSAMMLAENFEAGFPLLLDMVLRPKLEASGLEPARDLALQALDALEDEPQQKVFVKLRKQHFVAPLGRNAMGERESLEKITLAQVQAHRERCFVPGDAILALAGKVDWPVMKEQVGRLIKDWQGGLPEVMASGQAVGGYLHEPAESTQVHIGLAYHAPREKDPQSMLQRAAVAVLSGGMSGRLFTEVREKRGLCYSVYASYSALKHHGVVLAYSGTSEPRAQETLDVLRGELLRLSQGIETAEFQRAMVGMKASLVMQGESSGARAAALAADQFVLGRPRSLEELTANVDAVTLPALNDYVRSHPPGQMTVVTVGPKPLTV